MWKDPIVEEVRRHREELSAKANHDLRELFEREREIFSRWKGKVLSKADLKKKPLPKS